MKNKTIPSGWYFCAESSEVKAGEVIAKALFGKNLILWRTESGVLQISDAVCPHLGSDLGKLGKVRGEHLQCFSHKYTYNSDGDCVSTGFKTLPCRNKKALRHLPVHGFCFPERNSVHRASGVLAHGFHSVSHESLHSTSPNSYHPPVHACATDLPDRTVRCEPQSLWPRPNSVPHFHRLPCARSCHARSLH